MTYYNDFEIERLLNGKRRKGEEDRLVLHPNGERECLGWNFDYGYHLADLTPEKELSDEELLESAWEELRKKKNKHLF